MAAAKAAPSLPQQALDSVDAFILYNEREQGVEAIVRELDARGVSTHFWRRDVKYGAPVNELEEQRLRSAGAVLVLLGEESWGQNHLRLAEEARSLGKRLVPALIGTPPEEAFAQAGELFRKARYADLRQGASSELDQLAADLRQQKTAPSPQLDRIVNVLINGNEKERSDVLEQVRTTLTINRTALATRLRLEVTTRFDPASENKLVQAFRDPPTIISTRSWMLNTLAWIDAESLESRTLLLQHLDTSYEPHRKVRFWVLADYTTLKRLTSVKRLQLLAKILLARSKHWLTSFWSRPPLN